MKGLAKRQRRVLEAIIRDTRAHGVAPTQGRIAELSGIPAPWIILHALACKGYLRQPYQGAAWAPLRDVDGSPLRLALVAEPVEGVEP